ncbi:MAG: hypothetical protein IRZ16_01395 [Myxococcaceae bacterium]|nr:hypothetical protein [Myxococcaceae bacterium]
MSEYFPEHNLGPEPPRYAAEQDVAPYARLALVGAAVLAVFALAVFLMSRLERATRAVLPPGAEVPRRIGTPEIDGVNQVMFDVEDRAARARRNDERWLRSYGWIDADAGVAHIPIDEAMTLVLTGSGTAPEDGGTR